MRNSHTLSFPTSSVNVQIAFSKLASPTSKNPEVLVVPNGSPRTSVEGTPGEFSAVGNCHDIETKVWPGEALDIMSFGQNVNLGGILSTPPVLNEKEV